MGAQILALTYDAEIKKMKHGHNGANIPVRNIISDKIEITSQNHFYDIRLNSKEVEITHKDVVDGTCEAFIDKKNKIIGVQYLLQETLSEDENVINNFIKFMKR